MNKDRINNALDLEMNANGKYMIILEGDDYWTDSTKLQEQVDFMENHPEYIACGHKFEVVDRKGNIYEDKDVSCQVFQDNPYNKQVFEKGLVLSHINTLLFKNVSRDRSVDLRLFTDFGNVGGDFILQGYLALNGKMYCIPKVMSHYRKVIDKDSSSYSAQMEKYNRRDELFSNVLKLEKYFNEIDTGNMEQKKKATYASAVFMWNRKRTRANFLVVKNIILSSGQPMKYTWWLVRLLISRFILNHTGKRHQRVKF